MDLGLSGKIVLVTGASSGIGAAAARLFAQEGAHVAVGYLQNLDGARRTAAAVEAAGSRAWLCRLDLHDLQSLRQAAEDLLQQVMGLDILVLCAGKNIITPLTAITAEEWGQVMDVNLNGPFFLTQTLAPHLREGGAIVTVASVAAHTGNPNHIHYAAAKAGLVNLTKSLARALAPRVRVNCVAPGITLTPMGSDTVAALPPDYAEKKLLVGRFATPEEIARWIVFVASPAGAFMTGATIDINGGRDLR